MKSQEAITAKVNPSSNQRETHQNEAKKEGSQWTQLIKQKKIGESKGGGKQKSISKMTGIRKKIDHIRQLMRPESQMYRTMLPKTLEFGHEFTCSYTKHGAGGQVKNIFYNKNIRSFVSYNEKQLHVWNAANGQQVMNINFFDETQSHTISTIVYSATHQLYLAISTDFKLHIFNEHLILIGWFPLKVRLVHFAYFYEEKSTLITAGIDGCFMFKINVKSKYEPKQAVLLDPEGNSFHAELGPRIKLEKMPLWIKGLKVNEKQNIIFSWSQLKACFNDLNGKILYRYKKLTTYEDYITDLIVSEKYKYFVTSTFSGSVIVWKLQRKKEMIHSFNAHTKSVTSLQEIPDQPTLFLSASNDNTIRIFSLDKFTELYSFILPAGVTNINLLSEKIFACFYNDQIKIGKLHHLALSFHSSNIEVKQIKKMFRDVQFRNSDQKENNTADTVKDIVMTLFSDNSVHLQSSDRVDSKMISTIYPPPTAKNVVFLGYCMNLDRIFLMLVSGTICVYRINQAETAILEKMLQSNMIKDTAGKALNQNITSICFAATIPPWTDVDVYNEASSSNAKGMNKQFEKYQEQLNKYPADKTDRFLALGLSKGSVIFVPVHQIDLIYARFSFHRQAITNIVEIESTGKFVTICEELNICLWGFKDNKQQITRETHEKGLYKFEKISFNQMYRPISNIISMREILLVAFKPCDTQVFRYDRELEDLVHIKTDTTFEHESEITDVDTFPEKNLFISGSMDGFVKVWNAKKEMIREIKFPEPVYSVSFLNKDCDILVGHLGKVSTVSHKDYVPYEIAKLYQPSAEDVENFFSRKRTDSVKPIDSDLFAQLKMKDDELKRQNMIMTKGTKQSQKIVPIKIAKQPDKGILKAKAAQKANAKKEVKIHNESSENEDQSEYSDDEYSEGTKRMFQDLSLDLNNFSADLNIDDDSYEGKSKQSSVQALSGDEDIHKQYDELHQQQQIVNELAEEKWKSKTKKSNEKGKGKNKQMAGASLSKDGGRDVGESSILDMFKQQRGSTRNKSQMTASKTTTAQIADKGGLISQRSEKNYGGSTSREDKRGGFSLDYIDTSVPETTAEAVDLEQMRIKNSVMLQQFTSYQTTAIPKKVTDLHYQLAVQRLLHPNRKIEHPTRRDYVLEKIQNNINVFNDPSGDGKLEIALAGTQSQISKLATLKSDMTQSISAHKASHIQISPKKNIAMPQKEEQEAKDALLNFMSINQSQQPSPSNGLNTLPGRLQNSSVDSSHKPIAPRNASPQQSYAKTKPSSDFVKSHMESGQDVTARTLSLQKNLRQEVISNRNVPKNGNKNFISILGQQEGSASYFEIMRSEPKDHLYSSEVRSSTNSRIKAAKDLNILPKIQSKSKLKGDSSLTHPIQTMRKDVMSNRHLPMFEKEQMPLLDARAEPGQVRGRGSNMNQVPLVKHLIAKKNQKFQINSTQRQPSHQLFQNMESTASGSQHQNGDGHNLLAQNATVSGKGLVIAAARGSRETQLDSIISQRPSQHHQETSLYASAKQQLHRTRDTDTSHPALVDTLDQERLEEDQRKMHPQLKYELRQNKINAGLGSSARIQHPAGEARILKGQSAQENRLLRNKQTTVAGGLSLSPNPYVNRMKLLEQDTRAHPSNPSLGINLNVMKIQQKNVYQGDPPKRQLEQRKHSTSALDDGPKKPRRVNTQGRINGLHVLSDSHRAYQLNTQMSVSNTYETSVKAIHHQQMKVSASGAKAGTKQALLQASEGARGLAAAERAGRQPASGLALAAKPHGTSLAASAEAGAYTTAQ